jgi:V/A-type H+-transporting ATPase subunit I
MFRATPMMRLKAVVLAQDERAVLNCLGRLGAVHLTRAKPDPDMAPFALVEHLSELARHDRIRGIIRELHESLEIPSLPKEAPARKRAPGKADEPHHPPDRSDTRSPRQEVSTAPAEEEATKTAAERDWLRSEFEGETPRTLFGEGTTEVPPMPMTIDRAEDSLGLFQDRCSRLLERRQLLSEHNKELSVIHERLSFYRGLDIPLTRPDQFSFLHFVTGSMPVQNFDNLRKEVGKNVVLHPLAQQKGQQMLFAITTRQGRSAMEETLQQIGFQRETLPVVEGSTVDRMFEQIEREQEKVAAELEEVNGKLKVVATECALPLAEIERFVDKEYRLLDASRKFPHSRTAVMISGWVPAGDVGAVEQRVQEVTGGRYVLEATPPDTSTDKDIPVLLKHSRLFRPFEMLIAAYGLPDYQELEPTLFVALSYIVMFGMMFGDAGQGMVLVACGVGALLAGRSRTVKDLGILLLFGGSSAAIFGIVYGSYFGIEAFKKYALWHDPLEGDPMELMYGAIGIGIVLISLGLILNIINRLRRGDVIGGILDKFGLVGLVFYWGSLVLLTNGAALRAKGLITVSMILFFGIPIVGWAIKEPLEHFARRRAGEGKHESAGLIGLIMESCVGAFEAILSYLANTISFVRLAAYAMSHAALLFAAFMLAAEVRGSFGGGVWSLLVIILGNLIAIVLEGVIASVQALRLEYYEFFGKFFSGGGKPFEPFRLTPDNEDSAR